MCGISQQERIEEGMRPGLDRSHVGLKFDTMLQSVMENYLMTHDYLKYSLEKNVEFIKEAFVILHNKAIDCNNCAIQNSCSRCNGPLEKCTVSEVKMWKSMGKDAWKEAKLQCSRKLPPLTFEVENKHLGKRKRLSDESEDESTPRKTKDERVAELLRDWYLKKTCAADDSNQIKVKVLWDSFKIHCTEYRQDPHGFRSNYFLPFMDEQGHLIKTDNHHGIFFAGIQLKPDINEKKNLLALLDYQNSSAPAVGDPNEAVTKYEPLTLQQQRVFDGWFYTYCKIKVRNINPYKVIKIQLRKKAPNSYNKYCEELGYNNVTKNQFNEVLKVKLGSNFDGDSTCTGRKGCYKHIKFACCSAQDICDKTNILCIRNHGAGDHDVGTFHYQSEDESSPKTKDEQVVQLLPPLTFEPVVENKHLGKHKRFSDESEDESKRHYFGLLQEWYLKTCETVVSSYIIARIRIPVEDLWESFTDFKYSNIICNHGFKNMYFLPFMKEKGHSIEIDNHTKFYVGIKWKT
jgi:hypothetical protein